jgi:putative transposase
MEELKQERPKDISRACRIMGTSRSSMTYLSVKNDVTLMERLQKLAIDHPREGFWKCHFRIRNSGEIINHKRVYRVYKMLGLPMRRKHKKRIPARIKEPLEVPPTFTHTWSMDFMSDALEGGRKFSTS